jgi:hypothetical protein
LRYSHAGAGENRKKPFNFANGEFCYVRNRT